MNTGQMMLTICALVLLSTLVLNFNKGYDQSSTTVAKSKFDITAIEVATAYLENIKNLNKYAFDEKTKTAYISDPANLSAIGKDASESRTNDSTNTYDDIDDFNGDTTSTQVFSGTRNAKAIYYLKAQVEYFDPATFNVTTAKTFSKKVTIKLASPSMASDTIKLSTIISYWRF